ncbi:MAG TPA: serine/threonine-protein kinase [Anaeromyxobacteraceae bacterium]|nr:serine/threonine-protein kinase [Anaeromyxobacteraceae bacterium]
MSQAALIPLREPCPRCGYLADPSSASLNFCPKCGTDLRPAEDRVHPASQAWVGRVIADRYRLIALLGEGGMGSVFKAEHVRMGKALAVKLLRGAFARDPAAVARFRSEAQIVSRLSHPHTIAVFDFGEIEGDDGGFYLAMEYVPGKDLSAVMREQRRLPEARALHIADQLLGSLGEAHEAGIVHRDIKPANVMLMPTRTEGDFVKVLDFGIAKLRDAGGDRGDTSAGAIIGTPNYLSPEQARGEELDARADLYSVGAVLYELVSGRPPFMAPNPMAVVSAHLTQAPTPIGEMAPGVSAGFAAVVHKALSKKPEDRFQTADDMRVALQRAATPDDATLSLDAGEAPEVTGELAIAKRQDFADLDRHIRTIRRGKVLGPVAVLAALSIAALVAWRWTDLYVLLNERAPGIAGALPISLRPSDFYDGEEHEPNDVPALANRLPLPPGPDGRRAMGVAEVRGHIGAKLNAVTGDVDVYRIEVPRSSRPLVLHAVWSGDNPGEGIRGLRIALTLNRERGGSDPRRSAPLVAQVDRAAPGRTAELTAAVVPGTYYLAVREKHREGEEPVEKPSDWYRLRVWLAEPQPGEEVEPNDEPDSATSRFVRYPQWRDLAERNPLGEGSGIHAATAEDDPDTFSVAPRSAGEMPEAVALVPAPELALEVQAWAPDDEDLRERAQDRNRFHKLGEGDLGQLLLLKLPGTPRDGVPVLVRVRARRGEGAYQILALGQGSASGPAALRLVDELARTDRSGQALVLAAAFAKLLPGSAAKGEILLAAGKIAEQMAASGAPDLAAAERASQLLGEPVFEMASGKARYGGAFEALVQGEGRIAEEASFRLITRARPCGPAEVARRGAFFLQRFPDSAEAPDARLLVARAEEESYWRTPTKDALRRAVDAWDRIARQKKGEGVAEAKKALKRLQAKHPQKPAKVAVLCQ